MPRGGSRPGAGRKPLSATEKARARAKRQPKAGKGKSKSPSRPPARKGATSTRSEASAVRPPVASPEVLDPLSYMLKVMNNPRATPERRDRMAVAAAPFMHGKVAEKGKKDQRKDGAQVASQGKFSSAPPPRSPRVN